MDKVSMNRIAGTNGNTDNWKKVTSISDITGTWENTFSLNVPAAGDYNNSLATVFGVPIPKTTVKSNI
jgi:hypothetical protein